METFEMHDAPEIVKDGTLLPCPFCGGEATMEISEPHKHNFALFMQDSSGYVIVSCDYCSASVMVDGTDQELGKLAWNERDTRNKE